MGSEDLLLKNIMKGIFVQEGSSGTLFDHGYAKPSEGGLEYESDRYVPAGERKQGVFGK